MNSLPLDGMRMRTITALLCRGFVVLLCGCSSLGPYHTVAPTDGIGSRPIDCKADTVTWLPSPVCASFLSEKAPDYELYFTEFDDQGWSYRSPEFGAAKLQIDYAGAAIRDSIWRNQGVSIVTFVHGWKHNAAYDDEDVRIFRRLLTGLSHIESVDGVGCKRRVIGVYAGWRGKSLDLTSDLQDITFWERKDAAARVAQGSIRELFARIRALQIEGNQRGGRPSTSPCKSHPVRSMFIGHSFGGLIVFAVLSEALIRDIADMEQASSRDSPESLSTAREGDLVLLVNPAVEATRYDALAQAFADGHQWDRYRAPLFVSITSTDDLATRIAFPLGRQASTVFDTYTPGVETTQRKANVETLGQDLDYITMNLSTLDQYNAGAGSGKPLAPIDTCAGYEFFSADKDIGNAARLQEHVRREQATFVKFRRSLGTPPDGAHAYPRQFCGDQGMVLFLSDGSGGGISPVDANAPVWNIQTAHPIVNDHGDVTNTLLWQFVRQLYYDSEDDTIRAVPK